MNILIWIGIAIAVVAVIVVGIILYKKIRMFLALLNNYDELKDDY